MTPLKRALAVLALPTVLALSLTACGSSSTDTASAPASASQDDFCAAVNNTPNPDTDDVDATVSAAHDYASKLTAVGTPSDMTDSERAGFEDFTSKLAGLSSSDAEAFSESTQASDVFGDDAGDVTAYLTYVAKNCVDTSSLSSDLPDPSDIPSDLGSDLPTDLPS